MENVNDSILGGDICRSYSSEAIDFDRVKTVVVCDIDTDVVVLKQSGKIDLDPV